MDEPAQRCLMHLYAASGQRAAALRQYAACARVLQEELDTLPEEETVRLEQAIRERQRLPERRVTTVDLAAPQTAPRYRVLPLALTPFVGREAEVSQVRHQLRDPQCRLLTLVGFGGIGKTRLAIEAALGLAEVFADGIVFVPLAPTQSVDGILPAIAHAMAFLFRRSGDPQQQLLDHLRDLNLLLVLDNLEHLLHASDQTGPDAADAVVEILDAAAGVKVLATSRAGLHVHGEHLLLVSGLDYPADERRVPDACERSSAVELFVASARRVYPDLCLAEDELAHVVEICRLMEGLPLAIVLAAAWVSVLSPKEIAAEIRDSLDILATDVRRIPAEGVSSGDRHRSIRAVFDHSWHLMTPREREVFCGLSVFRGSFTREAAKNVTSASLRDLSSLVRTSLVQHAPGRRFEIHELLRRYGAEQLARTPDGGGVVRDRHCAYFVDVEWLERRSGQLKMARGARRDGRGVRERRCCAGVGHRSRILAQIDRAIEGLCRLYNNWQRRHREGYAACQMAVARFSAMPSGDKAGGPASLQNHVLTKALAWQAHFALKLGLPEQARQLLDRSLSIAKDKQLVQRPPAGNRACSLLQMAWIVDHARELSQPVAFLLCDIDDFRQVNHVYGYETGDTVLAGVARTVGACIQESGYLGRWGGEEFVIVLPNVGAQEAVLVAQGVCARVRETVHTSQDGCEVRVTISVGVALYPQHALDVISLHGRADQAAHSAKQAGKDRVALYSGA